jgi:transposase
MPRTVDLAPHLTVEDVAAHAQTASDPVLRRHWQLVLLVAQGQRIPAAAAVIGYTASWARTLLHRYNADGPAGLVDRRHTNPGQPPLLTPGLRRALTQALAGPAPDGGAWTSATVAAWLAARLGRPVAPQRGWEALRALGYTPHRLR